MYHLCITFSPTIIACITVVSLLYHFSEGLIFVTFLCHFVDCRTAFGLPAAGGQVDSSSNSRWAHPIDV